MATSSNISPPPEMLRSKFRGAMLGAMVGDCMGDRFERAERPRPQSIKKVADFFTLFRSKEQDAVEKKPKELHYTDDTAMMKVLADSLCRNKRVDVKDLAEKFTTEYYTDPKWEKRNYGLNVVDVFKALQGKPDDVLEPARLQFYGTGSYGNGAAMRITPVALFFHKVDTKTIIDSCKNSALVTHAHADGYNGAILLGFAIQKALETDPQALIDPKTFVEELEEKMAEALKATPSPYVEQLKKMKNLLNKDKPPATIQEVVAELGNNVTALKSVPTAIYSFLRVQQHQEKPITDFQAPNQYERTIQYAISLGGDTDTIGCMAGACCGAYIGEEGIPKYLIEVCEDHDKVKSLADRLLEARKPSADPKLQCEGSKQSAGDDGAQTEAGDDHDKQKRSKTE